MAVESDEQFHLPFRYRFQITSKKSQGNKVLYKFTNIQIIQFFCSAGEVRNLVKTEVEMQMSDFAQRDFTGFE